MFNMIVQVLLFCACFILIKSEENNTIHMEINANGNCFVASSYELIAGTKCFVKLKTPYCLISSKLDVNQSHIFFNYSLSYACHVTIWNLYEVYAFEIDVKHELNGVWNFLFYLIDIKKTDIKKTDIKNISCTTNVTIKEQKMLRITAAISATPYDVKNPFPIIVGFFGIIVICQTLYIVYIKRQKFRGRYRHISERPPQPLPLDIYDQVEDQHEQGFTNKGFNMADERSAPNVARKAPQEPPHRCHLKPFRRESVNMIDERTPPNVIRKPPKALPMTSFGQAHNMAGKRTAPNVPRKQSQELLPLSPNEKRLRGLKPNRMNQGNCSLPRPRPRPRAITPV